MADDAVESATAVNYIDVKLHGVYNLPPNWWEDGKPPAYADHPFRYEVSFSIDGETKFTFTHGRLLQVLPQYASYIEGAMPPPLPSSMNAMLRNIREVPENPTLASATSSKVGTLASEKKTTEDAPAIEARILWVVTPATDVPPPSAEEQGSKRRKKLLPTSATEEVQPPALPTEEDTPPCVIRVPLEEQHVAVLEAMMISGRPLELQLVRVLKSGAPSDWEDTQECYFRASIPVDLSPFAEPGSLDLTESVPLLPVKDVTHIEEKGRKKAAKRPKSGAPGLLLEEIDTESPHPYVTHGTAATVSLHLEKTLTRLASDRVRPLLTPGSLIPTRAPPKREYQDSTQQFKDAVKMIAAKIMRDFAVAEEKGAGKTQEQLFEAFQTTGQLAAYKEQLTPLVVKVVREKFLREPGASPELISQLTNELYVYLLDCVHATLRRMTEDLGAGHRSDGGGAFMQVETQQEQQLEQDAGVTGRTWLERAEEAETLREHGHAARCHQARIASCSNSGDFPAVWNDAAAFFVRVGDAARAEQCYREAIAHNPTHVPSLLGYGDLLLAYSRFDEAAVFLHAAADAEPSAMTWGHISLLCDLRVLSLTQGPQYESKRAYWEREGALAMKEAMNATEEVDFNEVNLAVSEHLLDLRHPDLANVCLSRCRAGAKTEMLYARLFTLCEQYENALALLKTAEGIEVYADEVAIMRGDCNAALGRSEEAVREYKRVLCRDGERPLRRFGPSYVHLGNLLITAGRYSDALGVFTLGIQAWPCSLMWLGAGITYYRMHKMDAAEECLSESNTLNNTNPRTWAYLSLVCLQKGRVELEMVLQQAIARGLADAALLTELGRDLVRASRLKLGEVCLRKALAVEREAGRATSATSCTSMYYLAGAIEKSQQHEAKEMYTEVVRLTRNEVLRAKAEEQLQQLVM
ncbi:putative tetratricopeptide repeat protein 18-like [Trypanosoma grayi]|uniref:putative tetratricopeptide repeat protein 18-like n=1 Tax=Trypanosoma grayi TaxID=71804 RepID=UPI0004F446D8|nr:putative tetratricopeptide repeat protein 18-like [Trypanosoma grayi]KEG09445.1 putative tetratricopeptide repeat protein 18-like [Trypanosoma grayi]